MSIAKSCDLYKYCQQHPKYIERVVDVYLEQNHKSLLKRVLEDGFSLAQFYWYLKEIYKGDRVEEAHKRIFKWGALKKRCDEDFDFYKKLVEVYIGKTLVEVKVFLKKSFFTTGQLDTFLEKSSKGKNLKESRNAFEKVFFKVDRSKIVGYTPHFKNEVLEEKLKEPSFEYEVLMRYVYGTRKGLRDFLGGDHLLKFAINYLRKRHSDLVQFKKNRVRMDRSLFKNLTFMNYLYGYIAGDGYYSVEKSWIEICSIDIEELKFLHNLMKLDSVFVIRERSKEEDKKGDGYARNDVGYLRIYDQECIKLCLQHGLEQRKSYKQSSYMVADEGYEFDFIRGLIDSDGTVFFNGKEKQSAGAIGICGTKAQMDYIKNLYIKFNIYDIKVRQRKGDGLSILDVIKDMSVKLLISKLYRKEVLSFCLKRKYEKAQEIVKFLDSRYKQAA